MKAATKSGFWQRSATERLAPRLAPALLLLALAAPAAGQDLWTVEDLRAGRITAAPGMSEVDAVNFANRFHPKPQPVSQVLTSEPEPAAEGCPAGHVLAYAGAPSSCVPLPAPSSQTFLAGRCYRNDYSSFQLVVTGVSASVRQPGRVLVSFEWLPGTGSDGVGAFYAGSFMPLHEMICPEVTR